MTAAEKNEKLRNYLCELGSLAIAFSGGVDSTFLLKTAHEVLGDKALAITANSRLVPRRELDEALAFCEKEGIKHIILDFDEMEVKGLSQNPPNRCYLCKKELFIRIKSLAGEQGIAHVAEGSNTDDLGDYRPGRTAITELDILCPMLHAQLNKADIRQLSRDMGLPNWNKQPFACLASRFPYGEEITPKRLEMIEKAEQVLLDLGFSQLRVRYHGNLARIETDEAGFALLSSSIREKIHSELKAIGFTYITIDLLGYRTGSMNETLELNK